MNGVGAGPAAEAIPTDIMTVIVTAIATGTSLHEAERDPASVGGNRIPVIIAMTKTEAMTEKETGRLRQQETIPGRWICN